ncbi:MAG TPA: hypothetical protein VG247_01450 [Pseudonocardiaceae bacterium]|nr:hypothetical protein [Pseudonocardiaceae bacterium]
MAATSVGSSRSCEVTTPWAGLSGIGSCTPTMASDAKSRSSRVSRNRTRANSERNARAVIGSVSPSPRKISIVRTFTSRDRGNGDSSRYFSTSSGRTPQRASSARAVSPTGPPPTISTSTVSPISSPPAWTDRPGSRRSPG